VKCPQCNNGVIFGMFPVYDEVVPQKDRKPVVAMTCFLCDGAGEIDDDFPSRKEQGESMKQIRVGQRITLREFGKRFHVSPSQVSEFEFGKRLNVTAVDVLLAAYRTLSSPPKGGKK
jgi:hypothetical protein